MGLGGNSARAEKIVNDPRPTKKQRELLSFIDGFIKGNGYGPSYREVMRALEYKSVSTVATHIDGLIARGFLRKETHSARSLEVVSTEMATTAENPHIAWLKQEVARREAKDEPDLQPEIAILQSAIDVLDRKG